jgi:hypothetical protein
MAAADMIRNDIIDIDPDEFIRMKTETPEKVKIIPAAESELRDD